MWWLRFFACLFLLACVSALLLLEGAQGQQLPPATKSTPPPSSKQIPPPPPPKADPKADQTLSKALEQLDPRKLGWMKMDFWQQLNYGELAFLAQGRYLSGPDYRLRLELKVALGGSKGEELLVSDGTTVWHASRVGTGERAIIKWNLKKVQETLRSPGTMPQVAEGFYRTESFAGVVPLLQNLRQQMTFTKQETATWSKYAVFKLTGEWSPEITKVLAPSPNPWPPYLPHKCYLHLDQKEPHWLYRLEWWGPTAPGKEDQLLIEMEFRNPQQVKLDPKTFTFEDPGKDKARDVTQDKIAQIARERNRPTVLPKASGTRP